MKETRNIIIAIIILAAALLLGQLTGLRFNEFLLNVEINMRSLLKVVAIVAAIMVIKYLLKLLLSLIRKESTVVTLLKSLIDYAALILSVIWSLRILGADINGIIAGLGILGLIIGMSAQDLINDLMTGIFLLFEQEYKVGDIIEVNGFTGKVTDIGIRTTALTDNGGNEKIFNNSAMKNILNKSSYESKAVVDLTLPENTDVKKVLNADYGNIKCLGLQEVGKGLTFRFVRDCEEKDVYDVRREMNLELLEKMKELGVL
ncbi:MAG: mechanosensitive ion channel [Erysipelotrichaceae bacterium]|nr:mechanosensitive ion channel [Erysipelotrichaceae bacterium]MBR6957927.1 mechanosensitive ion channel [Erysipelotrichaceae bacterium]